jgi:hypothetical protein
MFDIVTVFIVIGEIIIGFLTVYQWFNLRGIPCIDNTMNFIDNTIIGNLNRVDVAITIAVAIE